MKAGYAFLPIDPDYPMERIEYVIDDADVAVLLTDQDEIISKIKNRDIIDLRCPALYSSYAPLYDRIDDIDSLAYIIYTSGSTGKPKGVRIGHKSFSNYIEYATDTARLCREAGIKTIAVTSGFINKEPAKEFFNLMDGANIDLKGFSETFYSKNCLAHLEPVLDSISFHNRALPYSPS